MTKQLGDLINELILVDLLLKDDVIDRHTKLKQNAINAQKELIEELNQYGKEKK